MPLSHWRLGRIGLAGILSAVRRGRIVAKHWAHALGCSSGDFRGREPETGADRRRPIGAAAARLPRAPLVASLARLLDVARPS